MALSSDAPDIVAATASYEAWLATRLRLVAADLRRKHDAMHDDAFAFFRGTYYRWAQRFPAVAGDAARAPSVLAVGDLHLANFGTWRDAEGRLVWGVNDLDEAAALPYTNDLVRLAASAAIALEADAMRLDAAAAADAILDGYREALATERVPFVLAEAHPALRRMATERLKEPEAYWDKLAGGRFPKSPVPERALMLLARALPARDLPMRVLHRVAGMGSLGRERFVAIASWHGGYVAREAKPLAPPASVWARGGGGARGTAYATLLRSAVRCPDPFVQVRAGWLIRRLAPDCSRIDVGDLPRERDEARLLHAMGRELANLHTASAKAAVLLRDLRKRPRPWLRRAARAAADDVLHDWGVWRRRGDR